MEVGDLLALALDRLAQFADCSLPKAVAACKKNRVGSVTTSGHVRKSTRLPILLRVLGCLPLKNGASRSGGRRPRSLRGGNRGPEWVRRCRALNLWGFESSARCVVRRRRHGSAAGEAVFSRAGVVRKDPGRVERRRMTQNEKCRCGIRQSAVIAGRGRAAQGISIRPCGAFGRRHEVSILMATGAWYRGEEPGSKVSMTIIRPPQQGQGCASVCDSLSPMLSTSVGSFRVAGTLSR
jgi:hypothetical protein